MANNEQHTGREFLKDIAVFALIGAIALAGLDILSE
jgi:hypothetical protein